MAGPQGAAEKRAALATESGRERFGASKRRHCTSITCFSVKSYVQDRLWDDPARHLLNNRRIFGWSSVARPIPGLNAWKGIDKIMSATLAVGLNERGSVYDTSPADDDLVELALVLPRWQVDALAAAARGRGLTAGQALRRLIRSYCAGLNNPER